MLLDPSHVLSAALDAVAPSTVNAVAPAAVQPHLPIRGGLPPSVLRRQNRAALTPSRQAPNSERRHPVARIPPSDFGKGRDCGLDRFTAR